MALQDYNSLLIQELDLFLSHALTERHDEAIECLDALREHGLAGEDVDELVALLGEPEPDYEAAIALAEARREEISGFENPFAGSEASEIEFDLEDAFLDLEDTGFRDVADDDVELDDDVFADLGDDESEIDLLTEEPQRLVDDWDDLEGDASEPSEPGEKPSVRSLLSGKFEIKRPAGQEAPKTDGPQVGEVPVESAAEIDAGASEVSAVSEASEVSAVSEASEVSAVSEASEVSAASEASEVSEASDIDDESSTPQENPLVAALNAAAAEAAAEGVQEDKDRRTRPNLTPDLGSMHKRPDRPFDSGESQVRYASTHEPAPPTHRLKATADLSGEIATGAPEVDDDFDFDLGFGSQETPFRPSGAEEPESADGFSFESSSADDDFDFDLGFSNPGVAADSSPASPSDPLTAEVDPNDVAEFDLGLDDDSSDVQDEPPQDGGGFDFGFDDDGGFDFGFDDQEEQQREAIAPPKSGDASTTRPGPSDHEERSRDLTPHQPLSAVDPDDMFFELAEALGAESSGEYYRGEPLRSSDSAQTNPFSHNAPTGTQSPAQAAQSVVAAPNISTNMNAILLEARRLRSTGELGAALDITKKILSRSENEDAAELRAEIEEELEARYLEQLGDLSQTPQVAVGMNELGNMDLDHRAGFVLSQIDGMCSYIDLVELSSMSRLETLSVLVNLSEQGVIST